MLPAKVASLNNCKCSRLMIFKYRIKIIAVVPISYAKKKKCFKNIFTHWGTFTTVYIYTPALSLRLLLFMHRLFVCYAKIVNHFYWTG